MLSFGKKSHAASLPFRNILVPLAGNAADEMPVRLAGVLLAQSRGRLSLLHVIEVPFQRQLDVQDEAAIARAQQILQRGEDVIGDAKARVERNVVQARAAGAAIVDDAIERGADLILMGLPYKRRFGGRWVSGDTVPYVMRHSTAPVWCLRIETREVADTP